MCHGPVYMIFWKSVWWQFWFFSLLWSSLQWRSTASPEIIHQCQRTVEIAMNKTNQNKSNQIKKKQKPTKREMWIDGQKSAYVLWTRSWFLTRIHRAMRTVWFGVLGFARKHSASAILQQKKRDKRKKNKKRGFRYWEFFQRSSCKQLGMHSPVCTKRTSLWMSLGHCSEAPLHGQGWLSPHGLLPTCAPIQSSLPSPNTSVGQNPPRAPSVGTSHILHHSWLWGRQSWGLVDPTKSVVSFGAKSCRYLGYKSQFGEVSGKFQWPLDLEAHKWNLIGVVPCVNFHRAAGLGGFAPIL